MTDASHSYVSDIKDRLAKAVAMDTGKEPGQLHQLLHGVAVVIEAQEEAVGGPASVAWLGLLADTH